MLPHAGAARRGKPESIAGFGHREDGGGHGELRSVLSFGGRVRLFLLFASGKQTHSERVDPCLVSQFGHCERSGPRQHRKWCLLFRSVMAHLSFGVEGNSQPNNS